MPVSKSKVKVQKSKAAKAVKVVAKSEAPKRAVVKTPIKKAAAKELLKETGLKISVYNILGKTVESLSLPKEVFSVKVNDNLMTQAVRVYLANQRRGTVKTKSRGEVNISTKKIYKQKGTGRARHGAASAPIFVGGGIAFGPRPRDYSLKMSQKSRKVALFSALTSKLQDGGIKVVSGLEKLEPKTKSMATLLTLLQLRGKKNSLLLVTPKSGKDFKNVFKSARNIEGVEITSTNLLNTYAVLKARNILFMKDAVKTLTESSIKEN